MSKQIVMSEEVFEAMLDLAIQDLKKSGLNAREVSNIVEQQFGKKYAVKFCSSGDR